MTHGTSSEVSNGVYFANVLVSAPRVGVLNHIVNKSRKKNLHFATIYCEVKIS